MMTGIKTINPKEVSTALLHSYMLGAIAPRPIAFASTIDREGRINLSPFSFFNVFSSNPPILIFSPSRRVRDNTIKHTLENVYEIDEVVINIVNYAIVQQTSLASCEYEKEVNEFVKAGLTEAASVLVKPPRVAEAPVAFECKVRQIVPLGAEGGAGNLVVCEVVLMHIKEELLNAAGQIDPHKLDAVARMGADWYCRASGEAVFEVPKPNLKKGIGVDQIPSEIRSSHIFTGNDLGMLGNIEALPTASEANIFAQEHRVSTKLSTNERHLLAQQYLRNGKLKEAWMILVATV
jgi:flavin reductase (DIM6/NTAB) family NADH-FMN oxidoreductase RutF